MVRSLSMQTDFENPVLIFLLHYYSETFFKCELKNKMSK